MIKKKKNKDETYKNYLILNLKKKEYNTVNFFAEEEADDYILRG